MALTDAQSHAAEPQFARYAPLLVVRGAGVTLACRPKLMDLFGSLNGDIALVTNTGAAQSVDGHAPLMSLPFAA